MEYVKPGNSDLHVSRICLGCMGYRPALMDSDSVWVSAAKNK